MKDKWFRVSHEFDPLTYNISLLSRAHEELGVWGGGWLWSTWRVRTAQAQGQARRGSAWFVWSSTSVELFLLQALLLLLRHPPGFTCRSGGYRASLSPKPESLPAAQRGPQTPVSLSLPKQVPWAQLINVSRSFSTASRISISVRLGLSPVKVCHVLILCLPFFHYILSTRAMQSIRSFFPQDILFTRLKTTQNPRSRSFHLRTARMFECTS